MLVVINVGGALEQLVLLAVLRLKEQAYAVAIQREIEQQSGIQVSRGSIYVTLDRLEKKGYLKSWFADPTPERGGKAKRFFRLEPGRIGAKPRPHRGTPSWEWPRRSCILSPDEWLVGFCQQVLLCEKRQQAWNR